MTRLSDEFRQSLAMMSAAYGLALIAGDSSEAVAARNYLSGRKLNTVSSNYGLGLVTDEFDEFADHAGKLCFPYITKLGGVVSLKFRQAHDCTDACQHGRFHSPYETRLYNTLDFDKADRLGWISLVEGETDTLTLSGLCDVPAVGAPGAETWAKHPEWPELFRGYTKVYVFEDRDKPNRAGEKSGERFSKLVLKQIDTAELVKLPGKDVNDTFLRYGPDVIKARINA